MELITLKKNPSEKSLSISLPGDVLSTNSESFRKQIFGAIETTQATSFSIEHVEIDLARASMVDSVGLNLLVSIMKTVKAHKAAMRFIVGNASVERTFQFTRLNLQAEVLRSSSAV